MGMHGKTPKHRGHSRQVAKIKKRQRSRNTRTKKRKLPPKRTPSRSKRGARKKK